MSVELEEPSVTDDGDSGETRGIVSPNPKTPTQSACDIKSEDVETKNNCSSEIVHGADRGCNTPKPKQQLSISADARKISSPLPSKEKYLAFQVHATTATGSLPPANRCTGAAISEKGLTTVQIPKSTSNKSGPKPTTSHNVKRSNIVEKEETKYHEMCRKSGFAYIPPSETETNIEREARRWKIKRGCEKAAKLRIGNACKSRSYTRKRN